MVIACENSPCSQSVSPLAAVSRIRIISSYSWKPLCVPNQCATEKVTMLQLHLNSVYVFVVVRLEPQQSVLRADHAGRRSGGGGERRGADSRAFRVSARASPLTEHLGEHLPRPLVSRQA